MTAMSEEPEELFASLIDKFKGLNQDGPGGKESFLALLRETGYCDVEADSSADRSDASFYAFVKWAMNEHGMDFVKGQSSTSAGTESQEAAGDQGSPDQGIPEATGEQAIVDKSIIMEEPLGLQGVKIPSLPSAGMMSQPSSKRSESDSAFDNAFSPGAATPLTEDSWNGGYSEMDMMIFDLLDPFDLTNPVVPEATVGTSRGSGAAAGKDMGPRPSYTTYKSTDSEFWQDISAPNAKSDKEQLMVETSSARTVLMEIEREEEEERMREAEEELEARKKVEAKIADRLEGMFGEDIQPRASLRQSKHALMEAVVSKTTSTSARLRPVEEAPSHVSKEPHGHVMGHLSSYSYSLAVGREASARSEQERRALRSEEDEDGEPIVMKVSTMVHKKTYLEPAHKEL